jgi:hypothetical protein
MSICFERHVRTCGTDLIMWGSPAMPSGDSPHLQVGSGQGARINLWTAISLLGLPHDVVKLLL